jgi:hypothetical protein
MADQMILMMVVVSGGLVQKRRRPCGLFDQWVLGFHRWNVGTWKNNQQSSVNDDREPANVVEDIFESWLES